MATVVTVTEHPYKSVPPRGFWARSIATSFEAAAVPDAPPFSLDRSDRFMSAGSCFAANVRRYLESAGLSYVVTERTHPAFSLGEPDMYYDAFSARYGNIYTARQMSQLLERALGSFVPEEDHWIVGDRWIDPYRPGLRHPASSELELRLLTQQHLAAVREAVEQSTVLVFTLGLTEAWLSASDGAVFPACPGTVNGTFDPEKHVFHNFTVAEVTDDLRRMVGRAREINPQLKVILTVSPVPLVATATGRHVLTATTYSKSVLRVAADVAASELEDVVYFPAYELVTGPQAPYEAYLEDRRNVNEAAVAVVMSAFFTTFFGEDFVAPAPLPATARANASARRPARPPRGRLFRGARIVWRRMPHGVRERARPFIFRKPARAAERPKVGAASPAPDGASFASAAAEEERRLQALQTAVAEAIEAECEEEMAAR